MIVIQHFLIFAQNLDTNKYIITCGSDLCTFEINEGASSCSIGFESSACTISSIKNKDEVVTAIVNLTTCSPAKANEIADKLCNAFIDRKLKRTLETKAEMSENGKGTIVGVISLKATKIFATKISRKKTDEKFKALDTNRNSYEPTKKPYYIEIDSVDISFEKGLIKNILVKCHDTKQNNLYFSNSRYIPIRNAKDIDRLSCQNLNYLTFMRNKNSIIVLDIADVINYKRKIPFSSGTYVPNDTIITLRSEKNESIKLYSPALSESLNIRVFTDLYGYSGNYPNGILQAEAELNFSLNQGIGKYTLKDAWKESSRFLLFTSFRRQVVMLNRISPYFKISKIQENKSQLILNTGQTKDLLEFYKYTNLNVGTDLNIFCMKTDSKIFSANFAAGILRAKVVNDSIGGGSVDKTMAYINPNLNCQFFESDKIDFNLKIGGYCGWLISSIDLSNDLHINESIKKYITDDKHWWLEFIQSINLHPGSNKQNSLFFRAAQYLSTRNNYFTFQVGYSTTLSNLLKF